MTLISPTSFWNKAYTEQQNLQEMKKKLLPVTKPYMLSLTIGFLKNCLCQDFPLLTFTTTSHRAPSPSSCYDYKAQ